MMHRTSIGVDQDLENIVLHGFRTALADGWAGTMIATECRIYCLVHRFQEGQRQIWGF